MFTAGQILQERYQLLYPLGAHRNQRPESGTAEATPPLDAGRLEAITNARQTWLATDQQAVDEPVVIKLLRFGGGTQWTDLKLFEREVQVLRQLQHPRIPQCREAFHLETPTAWVGLIETYIPGKSLQELLDQGRSFSESAIRSIAAQVLDILIYLHGHNPAVLHRDIKPSNLILTPKRQVYLIDFGAVQDRPRPAGQSFTVVGTYGYTPMEQFGGQAEPASDLYALGATLVHLLAGVPPSELLQPDLQLQFCDRIQASPPLANWLTQMTAPALTDRFRSAQQALTVLQTPAPAPIEVLPQPRIQLQPTAEDLTILIPPLVMLKTMAGLETLLLSSVAGGLTLILTLLGLHILLQALQTSSFASVGTGLLLSGLGGVITILLLALLKRFLGATRLTFTVDRVSVQHQILGFTYHQTQALLKPSINLEVVPFGPSDTTVQLKTERSGEETGAASFLVLADKLSPEEGQWLVQEVQAWRHRSAE